MNAPEDNTFRSVWDALADTPAEAANLSLRSELRPADSCTGRAPGLDAGASRCACGCDAAAHERPDARAVEPLLAGRAGQHGVGLRSPGRDFAAACLTWAHRTDWAQRVEQKRPAKAGPKEGHKDEVVSGAKEQRGRNSGSVRPPAPSASARRRCWRWGCGSCGTRPSPWRPLWRGLRSTSGVRCPGCRSARPARGR